jgi:chromosomal replication initiator protein
MFLPRKFTNQFINSIRNNTLQEFTDFYMKVDVLAIDDVQFLSGKEKTQDTFFHIFSIICTSLASRSS